MGSIGGKFKRGAWGRRRGGGQDDKIRLTCNMRKIKGKKRGKGDVQRNNHEHRRMRQIQV